MDDDGDVSLALELKEPSTVYMFNYTPATHRIAFVRSFLRLLRPTSLSSRALRSARTRRLSSRALVSRLDESIERVEPDGARFIVRGAVDEVLQTAHGGDGTDDDGERGDGFHRLRASSSSSSSVSR